VNRGNRNIFAFHVGGEPGDGFFHNQGYAMLFSGWQGDLTPIPTADRPVHGDRTKRSTCRSRATRTDLP
jgi:hypothetical protein